MKTFMKCLAEAATAKDMLIGDVLENWNAREEEAIIEKAAEIYAQQSNLHKPDVMVSCEHEWHYHQMQNLNRIVMCMKCGKTKVSN